jgi:uncharacterized protein (TIGR02145 family)
MQNKNLILFPSILFCLWSFGLQEKPVKDIDGNVYKTVTIGTQVWMAENLKTTRYCNGDLIGTTTPVSLDISNENTPKYQWAYAGNENNVAAHGRLYTWFSVSDNRNICPTGWHVPTAAQWTILIDYLSNNGYGYGGGYRGIDIGKSMAAPSGWATDETKGSIGNDQAGNNSIGFTALPSGFRHYNGRFSHVGKVGNWWTTTESCDTLAQFFDMYYDYGYVNSYNNNKHFGFSVRCLRD